MGFKSTYFVATAMVAALVFGNAAPHAKADVIVTISGEISEVPDSFAGTDFVVGNPFSASFLLDPNAPDLFAPTTLGIFTGGESSLSTEGFDVTFTANSTAINGGIGLTAESDNIVTLNTTLSDDFIFVVAGFGFDDPLLDPVILDDTLTSNLPLLTSGFFNENGTVQGSLSFITPKGSIENVNFTVNSVTGTTAVPEPGSFAILIAAMSACAMCRRRQLEHTSR